MTERQAQSMDEILASIRKIVAEGPVADETPADEPAAVADTVAVIEPATPVGATTLEALVATMLEPLLKTWLDANLPEIVERATQAEIRRLTNRGG